MDNKKLVEELIKNEQYDLADVIDGMTAVDAANYIAANKAYFTKIYNSDDLEQMPLFRKALYDNLKTGKVDYDKEFGADWYKQYGQIPVDQIKYVAEKQGIDWKDLTKNMETEATRKLRYDIAHDGTISGFITNMVAPRSVEAVERGESPSLADATLDVGQNILYAAPWAKVASPLVKYGLLGRTVQGAAGNALTPAIMEVADDIAYDDPKNPRSDFSKSDVATETAINATTPWLLRNVLKSAGKYGTGKAAEFVNKWAKFGDSERPTREGIMAGINKETREAYKPTVKAEVSDLLGESATIAQKAEAEAYKKIANYQEIKQKVMTKLDLYNTIPDYKLKFSKEELEMLYKDPDLQKYLGIDTGLKGFPSKAQLANEESVKNWLTNQSGGMFYDQQSPWTRIPIFGSRIDQYLKEEAKQDSARAEEERILNDLRMRNMLHLGR